MTRIQPAALALKKALISLGEGGVIACPTEAVWGLSCDPANESAVMSLLALKQRPLEKGLILVAADSDQIAGLIEPLNSAQQAKLALSWPGPATWLLPHHGRVPPWIHGGHDTVAVRVSSHPMVHALCSAWGGPLVSTSANRAGCQPALNAFQVHRYFHQELDYVLPGAIAAPGRPSVIRDVVTDEIIRA